MFEGHEAPPAAARTVGRYSILDQIGSGGMAVVHVGRLNGPVGFSRMVAIKRLRQQYVSDQDITAMLIDEARLAAQIHHPNVVGMLDVVTEKAELYLVMEYVHGESLAFLTRGLAASGERLPPHIAANILAGALHGLHAAHEAVGETGQPLGIVHRDVSPQNILIGVDGTPRVLDFGVAKAADRISTTRVGQVKGKIRYMAPEQILAKTVGPWTDVWSASVTLWEALTGRHMFSAKNDGAMLKQVLEAEIRSPRDFAPEVPEALAEVVLAGLVRDPNRRIRSALDMARRIEAAVGLVSAREIGEWIRRAGREQLDARAKRMAELDRSPLPRSLPSAQRSSTVPPTAASQHTGPQRRRSSAFVALVALVVAVLGLYLARVPNPIAAPAAAVGRTDVTLSSPAPLDERPALAPIPPAPTAEKTTPPDPVVAPRPASAQRPQWRPRPAPPAPSPSDTSTATTPSARPTSDLPFPVPALPLQQPATPEPASKPAPESTDL